MARCILIHLIVKIVWNRQFRKLNEIVHPVAPDVICGTLSALVEVVLAADDDEAFQGPRGTASLRGVSMILTATAFDYFSWFLSVVEVIH